MDLPIFFFSFFEGISSSDDVIDYYLDIAKHTPKLTQTDTPYHYQGELISNLLLQGNFLPEKGAVFYQSNKWDHDLFRVPDVTVES